MQGRRQFLAGCIGAGLGLSIVSPLRGDGSPGKVFPGIDVLEADGFAELRKKRVGLLTHPAGVNHRGTSSIEILRRARRVDLVALFGPEHGIYGDEQANVPVDDRIDPRTGLPVFSLYGKYRRPTPEMLARLDVLVIDLQDLGVRSYTYISAMRYAIEECFKADVEVIVLDRPNPIGGLKVDGPMLETRWMSYVGAYRVPYVFGLTIGELARMACETPGWLEVEESVRRRGRFSVIPMRGWKRSMLWPATGMRWTPTSPAIPDLSAAMGYAMTGLGAQLGDFQHGYGTTYPFRMLTYPDREPEALVRAFRELRVPGLDYRAVTAPTTNGFERSGAFVLVTDWDRLRPTQISFEMMRLACRWSQENPFTAAPENQQVLFNKHVGSTEWWEAITQQGGRVDVQRYVDRWAAEARAFQQRSRSFWIYPA